MNRKKPFDKPEDEARAERGERERKHTKIQNKRNLKFIIKAESKKGCEERRTTVHRRRGTGMEHELLFHLYGIYIFN
jgi:hypothetical protein